MSELWQRLRQARDHAGLRQDDIAALFGITRNAVSQWESENPKTRTACPLPRLEKIALRCSVDFGWLATGDGPQPKPNNINESPFPADYVRGPSSEVVNIELAPHLTSQIPLISLVQAGAWAEAIDNYSPGDAEEWLPCHPGMSKHSFAVRVVGDSMTPDFKPGEILYVDPESRGGVPNGALVIARMVDTGDVTFKQYQEDVGRKFLRPLNTQYPIITDPFEVVGLVKYATRKTF
jgi:SOS-response transcriptional repressor LexA/DNA-binding XRE family transcriptional regulator